MQLGTTEKTSGQIAAVQSVHNPESKTCENSWGDQGTGVTAIADELTTNASTPSKVDLADGSAPARSFRRRSHLRHKNITIEESVTSAEDARVRSALVAGDGDEVPQNPTSATSSRAMGGNWNRSDASSEGSKNGHLAGQGTIRGRTLIAINERTSSATSMPKLDEVLPANEDHNAQANMSLWIAREVTPFRSAMVNNGRTHKSMRFQQSTIGAAGASTIVDAMTTERPMCVQWSSPHVRWRLGYPVPQGTLVLSPSRSSVGSPSLGRSVLRGGAGKSPFDHDPKRSNGGAPNAGPPRRRLRIALPDANKCNQCNIEYMSCNQAWTFLFRSLQDCELSSSSLCTSCCPQDRRK